MKIDLVSPLIYGLIRKEKENTERAFESCIANEREGAVKNCFKYMYDEYKRREGMAVLEQLDYAIQSLVSAPCRDCNLSDLQLSNDILKETNRILLEWKYKDKLIENRLFPTNKILLEGPPGNGKTSYVIALSKLLKLPLLNTNSSMVLDSYLGNSEKNVSMLFKKMPETCILFFDEFDALATSRVKAESGSMRAYNSIVTTFLINMETLRPSTMFIAATNQTDFIDKALLRRFDSRMVFENPADADKENYIQKYLAQHELSENDIKSVRKKLEEAVSYSAMETILRKRHKEIVMEKIYKEESVTNQPIGGTLF